MVAEDEKSGEASRTEADGAFWRALLHRWFVQYNPLYLVSALLVLVGLTTVSMSTARPTLDGELDVPALIAEAYAFSLIGGAWLLNRIGHRRPAVMLGLLAVLYQGDLSLLAERSGYLGVAGDLALVLWLGAFGIKLALLVRVFRLRLSRAAFVLPALGALAVATLPRLVARAGDEARVLPFALVTSIVVGAALFTSPEIESLQPLDAWGRTVLDRAIKATWAIWGLAFVAHVGFVFSDRPVSAVAFLPVVLLVILRRARTEAGTWAATALMLLAFVAAKPAFFLGALAAGAILVLRALRKPVREASVETASPAPPYRVAREADDADAAPPPALAFTTRFEVAPRAEMLRLLGGAFTACYLAIWTSSWRAGPLPAHVLVLDVAFAITIALAVWRLRVRSLVVPVVATFAHAAIQTRLVAAPTTSFGWGASSIGVGFALLALSIGVSYALRRFEPAS